MDIVSCQSDSCSFKPSAAPLASACDGTKHGKKEPDPWIKSTIRITHNRIVEWAIDQNLYFQESKPLILVLWRSPHLVWNSNLLEFRA
jgi:hypothetical protein